MAQEGEERFQVVATYSDVDMLGHVNNSRYIEWICDAFSTELFNQKKLDSLQINYEHEILPGEQVVVLVNPVEQDGGLWVVEGQNLSNNSRAFEALLRWQE
jgi:acyl-ACP thioesterase